MECAIGMEATGKMKKKQKKKEREREKQEKDLRTELVKFVHGGAAATVGAVY